MDTNGLANQRSGSSLLISESFGSLKVMGTTSEDPVARAAPAVVDAEARFFFTLLRCVGCGSSSAPPAFMACARPPPAPLGVSPRRRAECAPACARRCILSVDKARRDGPTATPPTRGRLLGLYCGGSAPAKRRRAGAAAARICARTHRDVQRLAGRIAPCHGQFRASSARPGSVSRDTARWAPKPPRRERPVNPCPPAPGRGLAALAARRAELRRSPCTSFCKHISLTQYQYHCYIEWPC